MQQIIITKIILCFNIFVVLVMYYKKTLITLY